MGKFFRFKFPTIACHFCLAAVIVESFIPIVSFLFPIFPVFLPRRKMIPILEDTVSTEDLTVSTHTPGGNKETSQQTLMIFRPSQRYEIAFHQNKTTKSKFNYALCLLRSAYKSDMQRAVILLNELLVQDKGASDRDYLFHLAVVHTRLKQFEDANGYVENLLRREPNNSQVKTLELVIRQKKFNQAVSDVLTLTVISSIIGLAIWYFRFRR